jgi:hypothetical protein
MRAIAEDLTAYAEHLEGAWTVEIGPSDPFLATTTPSKRHEETIRRICKQLDEQLLTTHPSVRLQHGVDPLRQVQLRPTDSDLDLTDIGPGAVHQLPEPALRQPCVLTAPAQLGAVELRHGSGIEMLRLRHAALPLHRDAIVTDHLTRG